MTVKNIFGFEVNAKETLSLMLPSSDEINLLRLKSHYLNKDTLWLSIKPIINSLSDFASVEWIGSPELKTNANIVTQTLRVKKSAALKDYMLDFYCYFYGEDSNILTFADILMTRKGSELAKEIVQKGAICLADLPAKMSWLKYKVTSWTDNIDRNTLDRWKEVKDTAVLSMMSTLVNGAAPHLAEHSYQTPSYPYIIPDYRMIQYIVDKKFPTLEICTIPNPKSQGMTLFSGDDLFGNSEMIQNLITSGVLSVGKQKIGINTVKKLNSFIPLRQFPENSKTILLRSEYVANAAFLIFGEPSEMEFPTDKLPNSGFLRRMYSNIQVTSKYYLMTLLANKVKGLLPEFFFTNKDIIGGLFNGIVRLLIEAAEHTDKGWISFKSFYWRANYHLSLLGHGYIYPDVSAQRPDLVKDIAGNPMPPSDFKSHIHDVIIKGMIEGMAAIGGIDLLFTSNGEISYLRLSEGGKWYVGISDEEPTAGAAIDIEAAIEVDDHTGLIYVKDPEFPYLNMLSDFAEKITDTRYCFTEKAFLNKCEEPDMLYAKIKRFNIFVLPKPGKNITRRIEKMKSNCNLVKNTTGKTTFNLLEIDPNNSKLHNLILDNKEIRNNSLRVEGCRLLVKSQFTPRFFEILTENGFLNNSTL